MGFPGGTSGKESTCQHRKHKRLGFSPWVGKIPWRRAWQPTASILARRFPRTEEPGGLWSVGLQRVGHDWSDLACMHDVWCKVVFCFYLRFWLCWVFVAACRNMHVCDSLAQLPLSMWDLSSLTRDRTLLPCIGRWILNLWNTREVPPAPTFFWFSKKRQQQSLFLKRHT